jgi:hypothetical protein
MMRTVKRILLVGAAAAGLTGLGIGVASLTTAAAASASSGVTAAQVAASTTSTSTPSSTVPGGGTNSMTCPNMSGSTSGTS